MTIDLAAMLSLAASDPSFAAMLDQAGVPPPNLDNINGTGPQPLGGMMKLGGPADNTDGTRGPLFGPQMPQMPVQTNLWQTDLITGPMTPGQADSTVDAASSAIQGNSQGNSTAKLAAQAALKGLAVPQQRAPVTHAGVSGGVKAPESKAAGAGSGTAIIQALLGSLLSHPGQPTVPSLGSLVR